jgi:hypothetical protein
LKNLILQRGNKYFRDTGNKLFLFEKPLFLLQTAMK